jgi:hypothetical protein
MRDTKRKPHLVTKNTDKLSKRDLKHQFIDNDQQAHDSKTHYLNDNYYRPLAEENDYGIIDISTMSDITLRNELLKVLEEDDTSECVNLNNNIASTPITHDKAQNVPPTTPTTTPTTMVTNDSPPTTNAPTVLKGTSSASSPNLALAKTSDLYLPKNITWEPHYKPKDIERFTSNDDSIFGLVVRIGQMKNERLMFDAGRIMTSLLTSFHNFLPYIKIIPVNQKRTDTSDIESPNQIIFDEEFYRKYIEEPAITSKNHFICRIYFSAKKPFFLVL